MEATVDDHILLMLAIKHKGKFVDTGHIEERLERDLGRMFVGDELSRVIGALIAQGLVREKDGTYVITDEGKEVFADRVRGLRGLNQSYLLVYKARQYYPIVAPTIVDFLKDRYVSLFRVYTDRAWLQRKRGPNYITIKSIGGLLHWVDMHGVDIVPYVHKIGADRPDWFVVDLDAGKKVGFDVTKEVTLSLVDVFRDIGIKPAIKFSGSRGFQVWSSFEDHELPREYVPLELAGKTRRKMDYFTFYSDLVRFLESKVAEKLDRSVTTSDVSHKEEREDKVLLDPSTMKPFGDVRAPYSLHYKTGLVSVPVQPEEIAGFSTDQAEMENVIERYRERGNEFDLTPVDGGKLFRAFLGE
ncbi:MAG: hypothetical protein QMC85_00250 [Methanocellales archaeon]|nr:hypothetical protein [Methanocellales archaeon]MDI6903734.1 hypothetical protein [Methanocellales archaeon]